MGAHPFIMTSWMRKRSEGSIAAPLMSIVVGVVLLFVGIFMVSLVSNVGDAYYTEDVYTTTTNSTLLTINMTLNQTKWHLITVADAYSLATITAHVSNTAAKASPGGTLTVLQNGVSLGTITVPITGTNESDTAFTGVTLTENAVLNLSYRATAGTGTENVYVNSTAVYYANDNVNTDMGDIKDSLVTNTATIFTVLGLVLIVAGLAMAITSLKDSIGE
jgi:uncharacterized membrane protein